MSDQPKVSFHMPVDLIEQAKAKAKAEDINLSQLIRKAVKAYIA